MPVQHLRRFLRTLMIGMSLACSITGATTWAEAGPLLPSGSSNSATGTQIIIDDDLFSERIAQGLMMLHDPSDAMDLNAAINAYHEGRFQRFESPNFQLGYSDGVYWVRLELVNKLLVHTAQNKEDRIYVSVDYPLLDNVEFYHVRGDKVHSMVSGDIYQFDQRYFSLNNYVFPIALANAERSALYIRIFSNSSLSIPIQIETERAFINRQFKAESFNGIYLGISIGLCIYNLFLWIGVRKAIYGLYVLVIINLLLFNTSILGFSFRLWPQSIQFQQVAIYLFSFTSGIAVLLFGMAFLETKKHQPVAHRILLASLLFCILCLPTLAFLSIQATAKLTALTTLLVSSILIVVAMRSMLQGYRPAKFYTIGQGAVIVSVMFTALTSQKVIPLFHLAPDVLKWCSAFELIFFSFGLADLVNNERWLREKAQRESTQAQQQLLNTQIRLNRDLDELVKERTEALETVNQRLRDLNTTDDLTGLRNRRYFNEVYANEYKRAYRDKTPISILMLDIDFFKQLNDTYGHQFGDFVLNQFGQILLSTIKRTADIAIRYGGEEFVVLLPCTDRPGAVKVAESIRIHIAEEKLRQGHIETSITVSIGVASVVPVNRNQQEMLLREADDMLYLAKERGRNRVEWEPGDGDYCAINPKQNINEQGA